MDLNPEELKGKSYDELRAMEKTLAAELETKRVEARNSALDTIVDLIVEFEITPEELNRAADGKIKPSAKKAKKDGRTKVPPKYRDPETGAEWTGRGVAPVWIRDTPKDQRDKFLIENLDKGSTTQEKPAAEKAPTETPTPATDAEEASTPLDAETAPETAPLGFADEAVAG